MLRLTPKDRRSWRRTKRKAGEQTPRLGHPMCQASAPDSASRLLRHELKGHQWQPDHWSENLVSLGLRLCSGRFPLALAILYRLSAMSNSVPSCASMTGLDRECYFALNHPAATRMSVVLRRSEANQSMDHFIPTTSIGKLQRAQFLGEANSSR